MSGDRALPLVLYHDHFLGQPGGMILFYVVSTEERDALNEALCSGQHLVEPKSSTKHSFAPLRLRVEIVSRGEDYESQRTTF